MEGGGVVRVLGKRRRRDRFVDETSTWDEEKAFAEDAGLVGGCVWPPTSYSCSFCKREFRSAQALGGHMNVHRRDRAKLKHHHHHHQHQQIITSSSYTTHPKTKNHGRIDHFCFDFTNPNPNNNVFLSSVTSYQKMSKLLKNSTVVEKEGDEVKEDGFEETISEVNEVDLELRLGQRPTPCKNNEGGALN